MDPVNIAVVGSTGGVGKEVVRCLLDYVAFRPQNADLPPVSTIYAYTRRETDISNFITAEHLAKHPRLKAVFQEHVKPVIVDFDNLPEDFAKNCDLMFSCLGSLVMKVGREQQFKIDHDYAVETARRAKRNGVSICALVSSVGANPSAWVWYTWMKGQIEEDLKNVGFSWLTIARPGLICCKREGRPVESVVQCFAVVDPLSYLSINASDIAEAIVYRSLQRVDTVVISAVESVATEATPVHREVPSKKMDKTEAATFQVLGSRQMSLDAKTFSKYLSETANPTTLPAKKPEEATN
eukprot:Gregarina_sp_Poly_1__3226@NODE_191_length_11641_cov_669_281061_g170_i0_p4_GENE_NODE_191_length_11641_cov_669_281061_g170_i0NODE_191_length_11641_cov_669_281061_g170_i0_p4_ORF_typecomplete_len296_score42_46HIM1/PF08732_10/6_5e25NAD_binding_10/PF13460_6/7_2e13NmrA/PF05368_13/3_1e10Semialdhyde_dh/PF01118_24/8_3e05Semialdhyde_dh/PF01118_24/1_7e03Alveolreg_P311/PF11092_8/0_012NAD_binding_4/PF07993_12/0_047Epimerase/PF01370_21/0_034Sacchrp_dh_NADP/PF03435_18/0_12Sacchrp_dh_NADP/PF03435_18/2_2e03DapB_N